MKLREWWKSASRAEKTLLADMAGTSVNYLSVTASKEVQVGESLAFKLAELSNKITPGREMTMEQLRPDSYQRYKKLFQGKGVAA